MRISARARKSTAKLQKKFDIRKKKEIFLKFNSNFAFLNDKNHKKCTFIRKNLYIYKKSCKFAGFFENNN